MNETVRPKRTGLDIRLSLAFGLLGHGFEFRHRIEELVERVGHQLLRRAAVDGTGQPQLKMAWRIEPQSEGGLGLASNCRPRPGPLTASRNPDRDLDDRRSRFAFDGTAGFDGFEGLFDLLGFLGAEAIGNLGMLRVDRRLDGREARRVNGAGMLDNRFAERIVARCREQSPPPWAVRSPCRSSRDPRARRRPGRSPAAASPGARRPCEREVRKRERRKAWVR